MQQAINDANLAHAGGTNPKLIAAFRRIDFLFNNGLYFLCLDAVILLGVGRDLLVSRQIHKVDRVAVPVLVVVQAFVVYTLRSSSSWWVRIAHAILG